MENRRGRPQGARFSVTVPMNSSVRAAIATIGEGARTAIRYPQAVRDDQLDCWIPDAEVAEVLYTRRALDLGVLRCYLEADAPRVRCPLHGVLTAAVPWARPAARFTTTFEEHAARLCAQMSWSKAARLLRVTWRTLQSVVERSSPGCAAGKGRLDGVRRIGIDEKAWRKGHRSITVVIDHDAGRIIWGAEGRNKETLTRFFDDLVEERAKLLTHVSCDGASWIHDVAGEKAPGALICLDAFHVIKWAGERLDELRRRLASDLRRRGERRLGRRARLVDAGAAAAVASDSSARVTSSRRAVAGSGLPRPNKNATRSRITS